MNRWVLLERFMLLGKSVDFTPTGPSRAAVSYLIFRQNKRPGQNPGLGRYS
jgi:hypothetical protein